MSSIQETAINETTGKETPGNDERKKNWNIFILGSGFFLVYTGYLTTAGVSETILRSYSDRTGRYANGFISLGINAAANAITAPFAPVVVRLCNRKITMLIGGLLNASYVFCFINPYPTLLYVCSVLSGIGGTLIWIAQGSDMIVNSNERTITRNVSIFFAMYMSGTFGGNLYVFFAWNGKTSISESEQVTLAVILGCVTVLGSMVFLFSRSLPEDIRDSDVSTKDACLDYIKSAWQMAHEKEVMFLLPTMVFMGFEMAFFQGIFPTCIGATDQLENFRNCVYVIVYFAR